jgi:hypothetical protein
MKDRKGIHSLRGVLGRLKWAQKFPVNRCPEIKACRDTGECLRGSRVEKSGRRSLNQRANSCSCWSYQLSALSAECSTPHPHCSVSVQFVADWWGEMHKDSNTHVWWVTILTAPRHQHLDISVSVDTLPDHLSRPVGPPKSPTGAVNYRFR